MLGHSRPAGSRSDPYGLQGLLRDGLGGNASPPKPAPHRVPACQKQQAGTLPGLPCPHHPLAVALIRARVHGGDMGVPSCP